MKPSLVRVVCTCVLLLLTSVAGHTQGTNSSLSGVVVDAAGGIMPGATVVVKNTATGATFETVTGSSGTFAVPALDAGTYTVTVSLTGFKTAILSVRLLTGAPGSVKATLEIGAVTETIEVRSSSELVQTQSSAVTSTLKVEQMQELPLSSRNALYFASFLPGVETAYGSNAGQRQSTFSGLPQNTINITIDGVTTGNALQSGDGFFSMVTPRLDAVEEVTVTGATPGAGGGSGAVQIAFVTRSGTNNLAGSLYQYFRHPDLNSNYYFNKINNLPKNDVKVHQYGGRLGGPIVIPGLIDGRNKAFFFFNMEHQYQPSSATRTRTILNEQAQRGVFTYLASGAPRQVNLLTLAAANGQTATLDPTIASLLTEIRASTSAGTVNTLPNATNLQQFVFQATSSGNQYAPTARIDYNLTNNHRLTGTYYWQRFISSPDLLNNAEPQYPGPGFTNLGIQQSYRTTGSISMRSTLSSSMVNEIKSGWQWSPNNFFGNVTADTFANQGGYQLTINQQGGINLSNPTASNNPAPRNTPNWGIEDTLSWQRGAHSLSFGGNFNRITNETNGLNLVPQLGFGVNETFDPATSLFSTTNFPGASTAVLTDARNLYALLTGRVNSITGTARLDAATGQYVYLGNLYQSSRLESYALYGQDSWRITPTLTLNYGLRWEVQRPFTPVTNTWSTSTIADVCGISGVGDGVGGRECNLFEPGTIGAPGFVSRYYEFAPGATDYENRLEQRRAELGRRVAAQRTGRLAAPPARRARASDDPRRLHQNLQHGAHGSVLECLRQQPRRYRGRDAELHHRLSRWCCPVRSAPVLLRDRNRLGPPAFPTAPQYPLAAALNNNINLFAQDIEVPWVHRSSLGFQRSLGPNMAFEVRYVGNRNEKAWTTENLNEKDLFENGFLSEFKAAQANLRANVLAGRGGTFAYFGQGSGTTPLPTYLAYFTGLGAARAGNPAAYSSSPSFSNSAWTGHLGQYEPDPIDAADDLHANTDVQTERDQRGARGEFLRHEPEHHEREHRPVGRPARSTTRCSSTSGGGLSAACSSAPTTRMPASSRPDSDTSPRADRRLPERDRCAALVQDELGLRTAVRAGPTLRVRHELLAQRHRRRLGVLRHRARPDPALQPGRARYGNEVEIKLVGMSMSDLQKAFKIRTVRDGNTGTITVFSMPQDIIDNTRRAFNTDPTSATGYGAEGPPSGRYIAPASGPDCLAIYVGDCGAPNKIMLNGPLFTRFDFRFKKQFRSAGGMNFEFDVEVLNVFDNINFNHQFNPTNANTVPGDDRLHRHQHDVRPGRPAWPAGVQVELLRPRLLDARRAGGSGSHRSPFFRIAPPKRFPFGRGASFDLQLDLLNAFDNVNFN